MQRETVTVCGRSAVCFAYGPTTGVPILAVHGFRGSHYGLDLLATELAAKGFRVVVPDLPGCGETGPLSGTHDISGYGEWVATLALEMGSPSILLGHSMGAAIVTAAAQHSNCSEIVLLNPVAKVPLANVTFAERVLTSSYYKLAGKCPPAVSIGLLRSRLVASISSAVMTKTGDKHLRRWILQEHLRRADSVNDCQAAIEAFASSSYASITDFSDSLACPTTPTSTLILTGARDNISLATDQEEFASSLPNARFVSLAGVGHLVPYEAPRAAAAAIANWHDSVTAGHATAC